MYAIIETGGKQYKVQNGDVLFVEKLDAAEESSVTFDKVVALHNDKELKVGAPYVKGASVEARVVKNGKGKKIAVFTYKPYLAANTITEICRCPADTEARDGFLRVSVEEPAGCQDILLGLRLHLGQLQQQYPRQLVVETIEAR